LSPQPECPNCKSTKIVAYDQGELQERKGNPVAEWNMEEKLGRTLELTDGRYFCPSCKSFDLTFKETGLCWD
jgi:RNA polymerase subunit RPABC4/transcription elongation factor Spt4